MTASSETRSSPLAPLADFADVALIDAEKCAAIGDMSVSWWHEEVRAGRAPAPAVRKPRCTRWRGADVRAFWQRFSEAGDGARVIAQATKASKAAKAKRDAARREGATQ